VNAHANHWRSGALALAMIMIAGCTTGQTDVEETAPKGETMNEQTRPLPFGLTDSQLADVQIVYAFISGKTGAGRQEITIFGNGSVTLFYTPTRDAEPMTREGQVSRDVVVALLDVTESQGMLQLEDHYPPADHFYARRLLELKLPGRVKSVKLDDPGVLNFERIAGAVLLVAGLACPEALNHRFFPNL
jgi:hypothetical protein